MEIHGLCWVSYPTSSLMVGFGSNISFNQKAIHIPSSVFCKNVELLIASSIVSRSHQEKMDFTESEVLITGMGRHEKSLNRVSWCWRLQDISIYYTSCCFCFYILIFNILYLLLVHLKVFRNCMRECEGCPFLFDSLGLRVLPLVGFDPGYQTSWWFHAW